MALGTIQLAKLKIRPKRGDFLFASTGSIAVTVALGRLEKVPHLHAFMSI